MRLGRAAGWLRALLLAGAVAAAAFAVYAWHDEIAPIAVPAADSFAPAAVRRGAQLAALGGCRRCHTAEGGSAYAGGHPMPTPFGTIYSTNITPDPTTGIGYWSEAAFKRALRAGVDRRGRQLYPAFPYDHFTLTTDEDDAALYAFLMTRTPVEARPPDNQLDFPFNFRPLVAAWKLLFLRPRTYRNDSAHDAQWNRGAYLAEGLGHCGACHTPRNALGAEQRAQPFAGGEAEGWSAYAIDARSPARTRWDAQALFLYLRQGWHAQHGVALGPMAEYLQDLAAVSDADLQALARYFDTARSLAAARTPGAVQQQERARSRSAEQGNGAQIYTAACAGCHDGNRPVPLGGIELSLSSAVTADVPDNLIRVILEGLPARAGASSPIMPGFAASLTDQQLEALLAYVRSEWGGQDPWPNLDATVRRIRGARRD